jgi:prepilin-type N-terminal cleavage/methylation domain-containing protein
MYFRVKQSGNCVVRKPPGFTLVEVVVAVAILAMVMAGLIYGYVQANWSAEWSSMSLAAQAYASEGAEQLRAADWRPNDFPVANGPGTMDEYPNWYPPKTNIDFLDIPGSNSTNSLLVTNIVTVTGISTNPELRQIRSDCYWIFPKDNQLFTNTVILLRAPDQ